MKRNLLLIDIKGYGLDVYSKQFNDAHKRKNLRIFIVAFENRENFISDSFNIRNVCSIVEFAEMFGEVLPLKNKREKK